VVWAGEEPSVLETYTYQRLRQSRSARKCNITVWITSAPQKVREGQARQCLFCETTVLRAISAVFEDDGRVAYT
jgi:hypothetical protein